MTIRDFDSSWNRLQWNTRYMLSEALIQMTGGRNSIQNLSSKPSEVGRTLAQNAESWMEASKVIQYCEWISHALETQALEVMEQFGDEARNAIYSDLIPDEIGAAFDRRAEEIIKHIAMDAISTCVRGVETSSNQMTAIESRAYHAAARKVLEMICDLSASNLGGQYVVADILTGKQKRREEQDARQAKVIRKIQFFKKDRCDGGHYRAHSINQKGDIVEVREWEGVTRKADALTMVAEWTRELREQGQNQSILCEAI